MAPTALNSDLLSTAAEMLVTLTTAGYSNRSVTPIFLQTAGAKAIGGVFAFASIVVTCIQVSTTAQIMSTIEFRVVIFEKKSIVIYVCLFMHLPFAFMFVCSSALPCAIHDNWSE